MNVDSKNNGNVERVSTRQWAKSNNYNPEKLFQKLFSDDIQYLLSMSKLWEKRKPPVPLQWKNLPSEGNTFLILSSFIILKYQYHRYNH